MPDLCTAACAELGGTWGAVFGIAGLVFAWWQRRSREKLRAEKDAVIRELSLRPPPPLGSPLPPAPSIRELIDIPGPHIAPRKASRPPPPDESSDGS